MEAVEFFQCYYKMCASYVNGCTGCEAQGIDCELTTAEPEKLVAAVERWAKAHPEEAERERQKTEQEQQKPEHPEEAADVTKPKQDEPCVKTIQDNLEGAIFRAIALNKARIEMLEYDVSVIRHNSAELHDKIYALSEKVYNTPTEEPSQTQEQNRTNKDVLLAAFPNARMDDNGIPYACPNRLDAHYNCDKFENCLRCRRAHWLAEVEK